MPAWLAPVKRLVYELGCSGLTAVEISIKLRRPVSTVRGDAEDIRKAGVNFHIARTKTKRRYFDAWEILRAPDLSDIERRVLEVIADSPEVTNAQVAMELGITQSRVASGVAHALRKYRFHSRRGDRAATKEPRETECRVEREIRLARARGDYCKCGLTSPCFDHE